LALAIHYGLVDTVRALLSSGRHDANERLWYDRRSIAEGQLYDNEFCRPAHLALVPPRREFGDPQPPPQLGVLSVLVSEFGADLTVPDEDGALPLDWLPYVAEGHKATALDALLSLGGDGLLNARAQNQGGATPIFWAALEGDDEVVQLLLSRGASADVVGRLGFTPLIQACRSEQVSNWGGLLALLRASSPETRRSVVAGPDGDGESAIDFFLSKRGADGTQHEEVILELLASGASVLPRNARHLLPLVARLEARVAALPPLWDRHEMMVHLAFDFREMREAQEAVRASERRVRQLEEELRARGGAGAEDDEEEDDDEDDEGGSEGGGGK
jgi:hypothetical protein